MEWLEAGVVPRSQISRYTANSSSLQEPMKSMQQANCFRLVLDGFVPGSRTKTRTISGAFCSLLPLGSLTARCGSGARAKPQRPRADLRLRLRRRPQPHQHRFFFPPKDRHRLRLGFRRYRWKPQIITQTNTILETRLTSPSACLRLPAVLE